MENSTLQKHRMFHQKVKEILIKPKLNEFYKIMDFNEEKSAVIKLLCEFIYINDNIYRTLNVRKLISFYENNKDNYQNIIPNKDNIVNILKDLSKSNAELIDIKWLSEEIFSSIIVKPLLLFNYYKVYIENFEEFLNNLKKLIKEGNTDSFVIASLLKVKLVVVNNILEYFMENNKLSLMRYSGTPLPGGKSFIILKVSSDF
ncbi:MAG: hypothetical protein N2485_06620 [bacterium]|nr:hypothetical protein [bacterium]